MTLLPLHFLEDCGQLDLLILLRLKPWPEGVNICTVAAKHPSKHGIETGTVVHNPGEDTSSNVSGRYHREEKRLG